MDGPHFVVHSSVDGHLGCFHLLAVVSNAAQSVCVHVFVRTRKVSDLLGAYQGMELLGLVPALLRRCPLFPQVAAPFSVPTGSV